MGALVHGLLRPDDEPTPGAEAGTYLVMQPTAARFDKAPKTSHVVSTLSEKKAQSQALARANQQKSARGAKNLTTGIGSSQPLAANEQWMAHLSSEERERMRWGDIGLAMPERAAVAAT